MIRLEPSHKGAPLANFHNEFHNRVSRALRKNPERSKPERKNPNLFSGIYVIIPNVIIPNLAS